MSEDISGWVNIFVDASKSDSSQHSAFEKIRSDINNNADDLLNLVVLLEPHLTTVKDKDRNRASLLLAKLLKEMTEPLSASQIHHFCIFFNSRLADYPSVSPSLMALTVLIENQASHMDIKYCDIPDIFSYVFREIEVQSMPQTIREKVYELLEAIFTFLNTSVKHREAIKKVVTAGCRPHLVSDCLRNTLNGVLQAMYGEKDPRCLLRCFRIGAAMYNTFFDTIIENSVGYGDADNNVAEKIFNGFACYFPITFRPPPDDPFKITHEMLVDGLSGVLAGHPSLANFTTPYMIEQIGNPSEPDARLHALRCLCELYGNKTTYTHGHTSSSNYRELAEVLFELACDSSGPSAMAAATTDKSQSEATHICLSQLVKVLCRNLALTYNKKCDKSGHTHPEGESCGGREEGWSHFGEYLLKLCVDALSSRTNPLDSHTTAKVVQLCAVVGSSCEQCADAVHRAVTYPLLVPVCETSLKSLMSTSSMSDEVPATVNLCCSALTHTVTLLRCREGIEAFPLHLSFSTPQDKIRANSVLNDLWSVCLATLINPHAAGVEDTTGSAQHPSAFHLTSNKVALRLYRDVLTCVLELLSRVDMGVLTSEPSLGHLIDVVTMSATSHPDSSIATQRREASIAFLQNLVAHSHTAACTAERLAVVDDLLRAHCEEVLIRRAAHVESKEEASSVFSVMGALLADSTQGAEPVYSDASFSTPLRISLANALMAHTKLHSARDTTTATSAPVSKCLLALEAVLQILPDDTQGINGSPSRAAWCMIEALCVPPSGEESAVITLAREVLQADSSCETELLLSIVCAVVRRSVKMLSLQSASKLSDPSSKANLLHLHLDTDIMLLCASAVANGQVVARVISLLLAALTHSDASSSIWTAFSYRHRHSMDAGLTAPGKVQSAWDTILPLVFQHATAQTSGASTLQYAWILAITVNKAPLGSDLDNLLVAIMEITVPSLLSIDYQESSHSAGHVVDLLLYVSRGLVMRRDVPVTPTTKATLQRSLAEHAELFVSSRSWQEVMVEVLCSSIASPQPYDSGGVSVSMLVAERFAVVASEDPHKISAQFAATSSISESHGYEPRTPLSTSSANCTLMWRQKLWSRLYSRLTLLLGDSSRATDGGKKAELLMCICSLAAEMPVRVIEDSLVEVCRLAILGLTLAVGLCPSDASGQPLESSPLFHCRFVLRQKSLACILSGLLLHVSDSNTMEGLFVPQVSTLVPLLIQIVQLEKSRMPGSAAMRAQALQCIYELRTLPYQALHPVRKTVVNGLSFALDDPKRAVRKLAAKVRNAWIVLEKG